jgi:predicted transposase/invertase (TIGR01784 family)
VEPYLTPHDEFFLYLLSDTENARDLILNIVPGPVVELLDLGSISVSRDSFVDSKLRRSQSDVLIRTRLRGRPACVYVLVEHKSRPERWTVLQLLKYMVRIWEKEVKVRTGKSVKEPLPVIIPVIFYHGTRPWRYPVAFNQYFEAPADLEHYIPDFAAELMDLSRTPDTRILGNIQFRVALQTMKYIFQGLEGHIEDILRLLSEADIDPRYKDFLTAFFCYILKAESKDDERPLRKAIEKVDLTLGRETFMTIAESLIERGKEKGKEEGVLEDKQYVLIRQLDKKFGLTEREKESILACRNKEKLDRCIDVILTANHKSEVLRELD